MNRKNMDIKKLIALCSCVAMLLSGCGLSKSGVDVEPVQDVSADEVTVSAEEESSVPDESSQDSSAPSSAASAETSSDSSSDAASSKIDNSTASDASSGSGSTAESKASSVGENYALTDSSAPKNEETAAPKSDENVTEKTESTAAQTQHSDSLSAAPETKPTSTEGEKPSAPRVIDTPYAAAYALYRVDDDTMLAEKCLNDRISLASTTKLLTASVMLRYLSADAEITVGDEVYMAKPDSTLSYLSPGTRITVYDLLSGMLLPSGNDAAYTAAVNTAKAASHNEDMSNDEAVNYFCGLMNDFASQLGMDSSHFANPEGWDDPAHYTTMGDLIKLAKYVLTVPELREITSSAVRECSPSTGGYYCWNNTNKFIDPDEYYYRSDCIGLKTGTTADAGYCLISAFEIDGSTYVCAAMGCYYDYDRYELVNKILETYI